MPSRSPPCRVLTRRWAFRPTPPLHRVSSFEAKVAFSTNDRTREGRAEEHEKEQRAGVRGTPAILIRFYFVY